MEGLAYEMMVFSSTCIYSIFYILYSKYGIYGIYGIYTST